MNRIAGPLATWFGCGYFPWGPGTIGSLAAVCLTALLHVAGLGRLGLLCCVLVLMWPAIWASTETARSVGRKDPGIVVVDEVLGQWVTLLGAATWNWRSLCLGFILFRVFDIWKPWPVRRFERLPEGTGIVVDDLAAGVYGALILYLGGAIHLY